MYAWITRYQTLALGIAAAAAFLFWELRVVWAVLFAGYIFAAALRPAIDWLVGRVRWRALAIMLVYVALFALLAGIATTIAFPLVDQFQNLGVRMDAFIRAITETIPGVDSTSVERQWANLLQGNLLSLTTSTFTVFAAIISAIVISVYLLYEWQGLHGKLTRGAPSAKHAFARALDDAERILGSWVRGQLLVSAVVGALVTVALLVLGMPFAPVLGVIAALFELIPYAGPILSAIPALIIAESVSLTQMLLVGGAYVLIQQAENNLLTPIIMKRSVRMSPVLIITALLSGYELFGIVGVLLSVPFTAFVRVLLSHAARDQRYKSQ